jgi:hypothetical protein
MNNLNWKLGDPKPDLLGNRLVELRTLLANKNPEHLASLSSTKYNPSARVGGQFHILLWDREVLLTFPDLVAYDERTGDELGTSSQALLLYYLATCDSTPASDQWISFSELPDGRFYNQAYQGYSGGKLARVFKNDLEAFSQVAENLDGKRVYLLGDAAYEFQVLPLVSLLAVTWQGDEDFPSTYQILYDAAVSHHMPTDVCAILGSILTNRLIAGMESL